MSRTSWWARGGASAFAAALAVAVLAAPVKAAALSTLIGEHGTMQVGDKLFSDFSYLKTGDMPDASAVNVVPYTDGAGNFGLLFQGAFLDFIGGGGSDALLDFTVTVMNDDKVITGATLSGNPAVLGGDGAISLTETFLPDDAHSLSIFDIKPGLTKPTDAITFAHGFRTLHVQKDILAFSAGEHGGVPTMSFFTQTFVQSPAPPIPEPATVTLFGLGLGLLGVARLRRKK
ncbi:MAG: PEP-CTERM sorting domain-containing protein [Planctomycetia bacterium]|nr:PEP-CTERM sorting domain-containing protein [Planctomycetia bacterium]